MTLYKFLVGMVFVAIVVATWSYFDHASAWTIFLRVVICAVLLQIGYFLVVVALVALNRDRVGVEKSESRRGAEGAAAPAPPENVTRGHTAS